jgi:hypothetical protein
LKTDSLIVSLAIVGDRPVFNPAKRLDAKSIDKFQKGLEGGESGCRRLGLNISAETIGELREKLKKDDAIRENCQWMRDQVKMLQDLMQKEMSGKVFLYIPPEKAKFFATKPEPYLFGEKVQNAFPSAYYDITESGACLAIARATASVFHSMRVLEIGLSVLGSLFGVSLANTNWGPALDQIESNIRNMHKDATWKLQPNCKELQENYSQAASHFGILKDAWRNHTMHVRGKYTEEEAEHIHANVRAFMKKLAALGLKEQP